MNKYLLVSIILLTFSVYFFDYFFKVLDLYDLKQEVVILEYRVKELENRVGDLDKVVGLLKEFYVYATQPSVFDNLVTKLTTFFKK